MSDGALIIDTGIDNSGASKGSRELIKLLNGLKRSIDRIGQDLRRLADGYLSTLQQASGAAEKMGEALSSSANEAEHAQQALHSAVEETTANIEDEYRALLRAGSAVSDAERSMEQALGINVDGGAEAEAWAEARDAAAEAGRVAVEQLQAELAISEHIRSEIEATEQAYQSEIDQINQVQSAISGIDTDTQSTAQNTQEMAQNTEEASGSTYNLSSAFASVARYAWAALRTIGRFVGNGAVGFLKRLASGAKNAAIQLAKLAGRSIFAGLKRLGGALTGLNRAQRSNNNLMGISFKNVLRYGLGIRSLYALFNRLRTAIKDGLGEMAKVSPRLAKSLASLKSALSGLKGSLATAFAPIVTAVEPAITRLINLLTSAINAIGAFMAALTGQSTYYRAVSNMTDTANAAGATADAANDAAEGVHRLKRQLASFDQLNILSDSGSGGGSGSGGLGDYRYEETEIEGGITDFVARLREMWENADYEGIGRSIAGAINRAFERARELISWDKLGKTITKAVDGITGAFNGLVDGIDWEKIGETFGAGINTIINTADQLLSKIDWENLGKAIADGLNGLVGEVDWTNLGKLFADRFNAVIDAIKGAVSHISWGDAGRAFGEALNGLIDNVDWDGLAKAATKGINGAIAALRTAVNTFDWSYAAVSFTGTVNKLFKDVDWDGLADTAKKGINKMIAALRTAVNTFDWSYAAISFAGTVNKLLEGINWTSLVDTAASGINRIAAALRSGLNSFSWGYAGTTFANIVNGLIDKVDWKNLGVLASEAIGKPLEALKNAVKTFKFGDAAIAFANTINGFFSNKQIWADAGEIVSTSIKGLFTCGKDFLDNLDADKIAGDIKTFFGSIDWGGIAQSIWSFAISAVRKLGNLVMAMIFGDDYKDKTRIQQEFEDYLSGIILEPPGGRNFTVDFGLNLNADLEGDAFEKLWEAIDNALKTRTWVAPVGLDVPEESIEAARQEFIRIWNASHPNAPIDPTLDDSTWQQQWDEFAGKPFEVQAQPELVDNSSTLAAQYAGSWKKAEKNPANALNVAPTLLDNAQDMLSRLVRWWNRDKKADGNTLGVSATVEDNVGGIWKNIVRWWKREKTANDGKLDMAATITDTSKSWWASIVRWFNKGKKAPQNSLEMTADVKNTSGNWWGNIKNWFSREGKNWWNKLEMSVEVKNEASTWWDNVVKWWNGIKRTLGFSVAAQGGSFAAGGYVTNAGRMGAFSSGGAVTGSGATWFDSVRKYAAGTGRAHGTVFVAGEAGPEIVGHVNGRTEILNKSQLAQTMYAAIVAGMGQAVNALGRYLANQMVYCTNALITHIGGLNVSGIEYHAPAMASGAVLPYDIAAQIARTGESIERTLNDNNEDLIQTIISVSAQLAAVMRAGQAAPAVGGGASAQQLIDEINRRTQMFGTSPIMGV